MPVGVALGGGAARGWAHVGVLRALAEAGVTIGAVAGTSIGALVGAYQAAGELDKLVAMGAELNRLGMVRLMDPAVPRSGLFNGDRVCERLSTDLPVRTIEELPIPFAAVAADLATGEEIVLRGGGVVEAVRASISIPGLFSPVQRDGQVLVDGGLINPLPVDVVRRLGASQVIGVDLNYGIERIGRQSGGLGDDAEEGTGSPFEQSLQRLWERWRGSRQEPRLVDVTSAALVLIERSLTNARLRWDCPDLLIRPDVGDARLLDFHRAEEITKAGYEAARAALPCG